MRLLKLMIIVAATLAMGGISHTKEVTFAAADGLKVTADLSVGNSSTLIVLLHQASASRGEYKSIAPRLNKLGYSTLAVDQRSGRSFAGVTNKTAIRATKAGKSKSYKAARPDMEAAVTYARGLAGVDKIVLWGSSYSAAMVLVIAGQHSVKVDGVLSFSPGEYLSGISVGKAARGIDVPTFMSSARSEVSSWKKIHRAIPAAMGAVAFKPKGKGRHGSSALIKGRSVNSSEYWRAVETFLKTHF